MSWTSVLGALVSASVGAAIAMAANWFRDFLTEKAQEKKAQRQTQSQWWQDLRTAVYKFDLVWIPWVRKDTPITDESKIWVDELVSELIDLHSRISASEIQDNLDKACRELRRVIQLEPLSLGESKRDWDDFTDTVSREHRALLELSKKGPSDIA